MSSSESRSTSGREKVLSEVPERARVAWARCALEEGTSQSGRVEGRDFRSCRNERGQRRSSNAQDWLAQPERKLHGKGETHPIHKIEDQPHGDAELLKVQPAVIVEIRQVPHSRQLVLRQLAVAQHLGGLAAVEVAAAAGERGEDLPVPLDLPFFDLLLRHGRKGKSLEC